MAQAYISGIAGRFPKSDNVQEFWQNLMDGVDMLGPTRWPPGLFGLPPRAGSIRDLGVFDADYFGYSENEARNSNLLVRVLLEVIYESVVDSGLTLDDLRGRRTGLYLACTFSDGDVITTSTVSDSNNLNLRSSLMQQLQSWFKFDGPVRTVDTACSSSIAAIHSAITDMRSGACDYAVVTAINLIVSPNVSQTFNRLGMLSPTGESHFADVSANGYVRSDGAGAIVLARTPSICERIYASIADIDVNCDGYKEEGIVFPSRSSQSKLLRGMYGDGLIPTSSVDYVEAHGTGTQAGDRVELNALSDALSEGRSEPLPVGSVKSGIGHCEAAAGLSGLIKCVMSMHHRVVPPSIHYTTPNTGIEGIPAGLLKIVDQPLPLTGRMNIMGLSSFGFGGVNGHAVLMSYNNPIDTHTDGGLYVVPLTIRSELGVANIREFLEKEETDEATLSFLTKSMLSRDLRQPVKGYAIVQFPDKHQTSIVSYQVRVKTGDRFGSGTDANVFIDLHGDLGKTGRIEMKKNETNENNFERGRTDEFILSTKDVGQLSKIIIGHDDKTVGSGWFLDHVTVFSPTMKVTWTIACGRWLARDEDDGNIIRELTPMGTNSVQRKPNVAIRWTSKSRVCSPPPLWLFIEDIALCHRLPHKDLLTMGTFRTSVEDSRRILLDLSCEIPLMEFLQHSDTESRIGHHTIVCSVVCILAIVDVLDASKVRLDGYVGSGLSEIIVAYMDGCLTRRQCLQVALAFEDLLESSREDLKDYAVYSIRLRSELDYKLGPTARILARVGNTRLIAALPIQQRDNILAHLCTEGGVYTELKDTSIIYTKQSVETVTKLKTKLKQIIPNSKMRSGQYRSCTFSDVCDSRRMCDPEYFTKLVQTTVNQLQTSRIPSSAMIVSLCLSDFCNQDESTRPEVHLHGTARSVLECLGELHMLGHQIDVGHLYPASSGPLDCTVAPLSPLVAWHHEVQYPVPDWCRFTTTVRNEASDVYRLPGRDLEGSVYDPLALLIYHAWSAVCATKSKLEPIILHSFTVTPELMKPEKLQEAIIQVHQGRQTFSVLSEFGIVMSGSFDLPGSSLEIPLVPGYDVDVNENETKLQDDCEPDVDTHEVMWEDNWLDFINATLEYVKPLTQRLPVRAMIDPDRHMDITRSCANVLVMKEEATGLCKAGGLVVQFQPAVTHPLEQYMLFETLEQGETKTNCVVDRLLLYSLTRQAAGDDKLLLYLGCEEDKAVEKLGMVYIASGEVKHSSWPVPKDWLVSDVEVVVPFLLAHHILHDVAEVKSRQTVVVLPPLDTVAIYILCLLQAEPRDVYTATWDPETSLMVGSAFPNVTVLSPRHLPAMLRQQTKGRGVDICIKSDGSDMDLALDLVAAGGKCIQTGRPCDKDNVGLAAFLDNLTLIVVNPTTVFSHLPEVPDTQVKAALELLCSSTIRSRIEDGYPEPRGLRYSLEEQVALGRPVNLRKLLTLLDNPGNKAIDILDGLSSEDVACVEKLQLALALKPQEFSLSQNDTSYANDSRDQGNPLFDMAKFCTPLGVPSGCTAPPNTCVRRISANVDMSHFTSGPVPFIRISLTSLSLDGRGSQACQSVGSFAASKLGSKLEESSIEEDNVFVTPVQGNTMACLGQFKTPTCQQTMDLLVVRYPRTPLTPSCRGVKKLLTPSKVTPVLCRLNHCDSTSRPLFVVHPITGNLVFLKHFGRKVKIPCYGIQRSLCTPTTSVKAMASFYRNAIELHDPVGPYRIAGFCYGGMIAFEIANQLQKSNKEVECLVILDGGPSYVHAQIDNGKALLTKYTHEDMADGPVEVVALMNFMDMYKSMDEPDYVRSVLEVLPSQRDRVRMAVDFIAGDVVLTRPVKTKWLSVKQKVLNKDPKVEKGSNVHGVASEIIRLSREKKAEEYINSVLIADKYRPTEPFHGDVHLIRIEQKECVATVHDMPDYGLGQLCTGDVTVTYAPGNHYSFLETDGVVERVHQILGWTGRDGVLL